MLRKLVEIAVAGHTPPASACSMGMSSRWEAVTDLRGEAAHAESAGPGQVSCFTVRLPVRPILSRAKTGATFYAPHVAHRSGGALIAVCRSVVGDRGRSTPSRCLGRQPASKLVPNDHLCDANSASGECGARSPLAKRFRVPLFCNEDTALAKMLDFPCVGFLER
jgi:hypothetical protein